jgi:DNA invertase Pin-like site-specific DNA recombinase
MAVLGYARVSATDQSFDGQVAALKAAGAERVYAEKESGTKTDRAQLAKLVKALQPGDVVLVAKIDRLARSTRDFLNTLAIIEERQAGFRSLAEPTIDTTSVSPYAKLLVTVLAAFAELERSMILARCSEGRKRAQANGVKFGRKPKLSRHQMQEAIARREAGESLADIGRTFNVSHQTIGRLSIG